MSAELTIHAAPADDAGGGDSALVWSEERFRDAARNLYKPIQRWQTRIIRLHPGQGVLCVDVLTAGLAHGDGLIISMEQEIIAYEAISYTWGNRLTTAPIWCNGLEYRLNPSLADALKRFRYSDDNHYRYLWADAMCINQLDAAEKSFQVSNMFLIYRKARRVLVWLGEEGPHTGAAIPPLSRVPESEGHTAGQEITWAVKRAAAEASTFEASDELRAGLIDICTRPWIRRVWIQQEIFAAQEVLVVCGQFSFTLDKYKAAGGLLSSLLKPTGASYEINATPIRDYLSALLALEMGNIESIAALEASRRSMKHVLRRKPDTAQPWDERKQDLDLFDYVLRRSGGLEASDPRDFIYALLSLTNCPVVTELDSATGLSAALGLRVDYSKSTAEVFQDVTKFIIRRDKNLSVLHDHVPQDDRYPNTHQLPSWTIDWTAEAPATASRMRNLYWEYPLQWQDSSIASTISLHGVVLATVQSTEAIWDGDAGFGMWNTMMRSYLHCQKGFSTAVYTPQGFLVSLRGHEDGHQLSSNEYERLRSVRPNDIVAYVDGSLEPVYLRPSLNGQFSFVCISPLNPQPFVSGLPPRAYMGDFLKWLKGGQGPSWKALCATRREFIVC